MESSLSFVVKTTSPLLRSSMNLAVNKRSISLVLGVESLTPSLLSKILSLILS